MRVLYLGLMTNSEGFTSAFRKKCDYRQLSSGTPNFNTRACEEAITFKPDIIFIQIQTPNIITEECVKVLKETGAFVVNWTGDVRTPIPQWYFDIGKHIDLTCFSNMNDVLEFREKGLNSEYLEIGIDPLIYTPKGDFTYAKPIVFMGNNYGEHKFPLSHYRIEMVKFLKSEFPNLFSVYGNGWSNSDGDFNGSQPNEASIYRGAKIAINLSHFDYERYNSDRMLRILGSGCFCLTHRYKGIEKDYKEGEHLEAWSGFGELKTLINKYLNEDKERAIIAHNGMKLVHSRNTYDNMIDNILKLVK